MEKFFLGLSIRSFPRSPNKQADILAKAASQHDPLPPDVFFETLKQSSVNCAEEPVKFINFCEGISSLKMTRKKREWLFVLATTKSSTITYIEEVSARPS